MGIIDNVIWLTLSALVVCPGHGASERRSDDEHLVNVRIWGTSRLAMPAIEQRFVRNTGI